MNHIKESVADVLKTTSKRAIEKIAEAARDLIRDKIADVVATLYNSNFTSTASQSNPETAL